MSAIATAAVTSWSLRHRVRVSGGEVAVDVLGDGPPVVLTHGTPSWSYLWRDVAPVLAEHHTVYLWDLLGYGDSTPDEGVRPSVALHAATLAELVEHWALGAPALIGHDIGGATVLRAHLVHGVPTRGLAVLDAAVLSPWVTPVAQHMQQHLDVYRSMPTHVFHELVAAHLRTSTHRPLDAAGEQAYLGRFAGPDGQRRYLDQVAGFSDDDTRDVVAALPTVDAPALVVWGEQDRWLPLDTATRIRDAIPGAEQVTIPEAGHFLTEDDPISTAGALDDFLGKRVFR